MCQVFELSFLLTGAGSSSLITYRQSICVHRYHQPCEMFSLFLLFLLRHFSSGLMPPDVCSSSSSFFSYEPNRQFLSKFDVSDSLDIGESAIYIIEYTPDVDAFFFEISLLSLQMEENGTILILNSRRVHHFTSSSFPIYSIYAHIAPPTF